MAKKKDPNAAKTITRTAKFAVSFPGLDKEQFVALARELDQVQKDLMRAANKMSSVFFLLHSGKIAYPVKADGAPVSDRTLAYQLTSGAWDPLNEGPVYQTAGRQIMAGCRSALANAVSARVREDMADVKKGLKALSTYKTQPVMFRANEVSVGQTAGGEIHFQLKLWAPVLGQLKAPPVVVEPYRVKGGQQEILQRLVSGEYKLGTCKLFRDARKSKWMLAVAWTGPLRAASTQPITMGCDLGITHSAYAACVDTTTGKPIRLPTSTFSIPRSTTAAIARLAQHQREIGRGNRDVMELRTGHGRTRKLRPLEAASGKRARIMETATRQLAAAIVRAAKQANASKLVLENLDGINRRFSEDLELNENSTEAQKSRARYWRSIHFPAHMIGKAIEDAATREGLVVVRVAPHYSSKTCHACGKIWSNSPVALVAHRLGVKPYSITVAAPTDKFGRNRVAFKCDCGYSGHADYNAAVNLARRG